MTNLEWMIQRNFFQQLKSWFKYILSSRSIALKKFMNKNVLKSLGWLENSQQNMEEINPLREHNHKYA